VNEHIDALWVEAQREVSIESLARASGLTRAELAALVELGALTPIDPDAKEWLFAGQCAMGLRTAGRLRRAFDLEPDALALTLSLVERIRELQEELRRLRVVLPRRTS
jgi:hypothetical protein